MKKKRSKEEKHESKNNFTTQQWSLHLFLTVLNSDLTKFSHKTPVASLVKPDTLVFDFMYGCIFFFFAYRE